MAYLDEFIAANAGTMTRDQMAASLRGAGYSDAEIKAALGRGQVPGRPATAGGWSAVERQTSGAVPTADTVAREGLVMRLWVAGWTVVGALFWASGIPRAVEDGDMEAFAGSVGIVVTWIAIGAWLLLRRRPGRARGSGALAVFAPVVMTVGALVGGGVLAVLILLILEAAGVTSL